MWCRFVPEQITKVSQVHHHHHHHQRHLFLRTQLEYDAQKCKQSVSKNRRPIALTTAHTNILIIQSSCISHTVYFQFFFIEEKPLVATCRHSCGSSMLFRLHKRLNAWHETWLSRIIYNAVISAVQHIVVVRQAGVWQAVFTSPTRIISYSTVIICLRLDYTAWWITTPLACLPDILWTVQNVTATAHCFRIVLFNECILAGVLGGNCR